MEYSEVPCDSSVPFERKFETETKDPAIADNLCPNRLAKRNVIVLVLDRRQCLIGLRAVLQQHTRRTVVI